MPEEAETLAFYDHPVFGKFPAVTRNHFGRGTLIYEGTYLSDTLQEKVVAVALESAGVRLADAGLPPEIRAKHAVLADGTPVHSFFNFSPKTRTFVYGYPGSLEILSGRKILKSQEITLPPWDLVIVKE